MRVMCEDGSQHTHKLPFRIRGESKRLGTETMEIVFEGETAPRTFKKRIDNSWEDTENNFWYIFQLIKL